MKDTLTVIFTGVIAVMAFLQWLVFRRQREVMSDQRKIMGGQLSTMDKQLAEMKTTSEQLNQLVKQAAVNAEIGKESANAAKESAEAALLSAKSLKSSQRAHLDGDLSQVDARKYRVLITNMGASNARIVEYALLRATFGPEVTELPDSWPQSMERKHVDVTLPQRRKSMLFEFDFAAYLSDEHRNGKKTAIFGFNVTYIDIFNDTHFLELVYSYRRSTDELENLPRYNKYT